MIKRCPACGQDKPRADYYGNDSYKDGLSCWCKVCTRARNLARYHKYKRSGRRVALRAVLDKEAERLTGESRTMEILRNRGKALEAQMRLARGGAA